MDEGTNLNRDCKLLNQTQGVEEGTKSLDELFFYFWASRRLPACRRLLFPLLHAEKGRLRNAVANRVPASRWQGILFRINCEIISG